MITCLDPRTDPSAFLELQLGDAMLIRNAGGRVSPDVLKDLAYIGYLARTIVPGGAQFEVAVIRRQSRLVGATVSQPDRREAGGLIEAENDRPSARSIRERAEGRGD